MPLIEGRIRPLVSIVVRVLRSRATRQIIDEISHTMRPGVANLEREPLRHRAPRTQFKRVIACVSVVGRILKKAVRARASDRGCRSVQISVWELHQRLSRRRIARNDTLVCITQTVHLMTPVPYPCHFKNSRRLELDLRTEAGLLDITGPLIRILPIILLQVKWNHRRGIRRSGEAILQLKHRCYASCALAGLNRFKERLIERQVRLRTDTVDELVKNSITTAKHDVRGRLIREANPWRNIVLIRIDQ